MTDHKQVETNYGFLVDEEMVNIINTLMENNIFTNNSCQEQTNTARKQYNNKAWICFDGIYDVKRLLVMCEINKEFHEYLHNQDWDIVLDPDNFEDYITNVDSYNYSLRFPYEDIHYFTNELIEIMKNYLK
jgi:hypothetical protein